MIRIPEFNKFFLELCHNPRTDCIAEHLIENILSWRMNSIHGILQSSDEGLFENFLKQISKATSPPMPSSLLKRRSSSVFSHQLIYLSAGITPPLWPTRQNPVF
jgi:hypothetical protein